MGRSAVLVTGASSDLMRRVICLVDPERYRVIGLTRNAARLQDPHIEVREGDIRDPRIVAEAASGVELVLHAAAATHARDAREYRDVNVEGTRNVVQACRQAGQPRLAFVSSRTAVADGGAYGVSKLRAEELVRTGCSHWTILRPAEVYGLARRTGIDKLIHDARHRRVVPCPSGPRSLLYPIHVDDAAAAIHHFAFEAWEDATTHIINGVDGFTLPALLRRIARQSRRWVLPVPVPRPFMVLLQWAIESTGADVGFVPDQVPRLYCTKEVEAPRLPQRRLADYLSADAPRGT